jgi:acetyl esterase
MDPELAAVVPLIPKISLQDVPETRALFADMMKALPVDLSGVLVETRAIPGRSGALEVPVRIYRPGEDSSDRPGVLDIHGGGFVIGAAAIDDGLNAAIVRELGAVVVSVDYRLAPEHPFPAPVDDCYEALVWFADHAAELGVDPARIGVSGFSAGGCLAATTALLARDRGGPALAMQLLLDPVLDDRLQTPSMRSGTDTVGWCLGDAVLSWRYYLCDDADASRHAAPARSEDLSGLPPTYISVNELDCLRDEGIDYAGRLLAAGTRTELHCWSGTFHGSRSVLPTADVSRRSTAALLSALRCTLGTSTAVAAT